MVAVHTNETTEIEWFSPLTDDRVEPRRTKNKEG